MKAITDKLVASGYRNTVVPDSRIFVYDRTGGAIEVIWSRRDGDGKEVQRIVVQFNVAKLDNDWRFVAVHSRVTDPAKDKDSLDLAWEQEASCREPTALIRLWLIRRASHRNSYFNCEMAHRRSVRLC